jgi:hypothetical protein
VTPLLPANFTRAELLACVDRELKWRQQVYPRRVADGKMTQSAATLELARMRAIRVVLAQLPPDPEEQTALDARARQAGER